MKKILMLGGAHSQIPAIKYAKDAGYYVITCDYLPNNPGHEYSDEYYNVSTTDKEGVLALARKLEIDGVVAYASDPSASSAAYISEALNLPGASYKSVQILAEKDRFRDFLNKNGFNSPKHFSISSIDQLNDFSMSSFPVFVKPVDSSGSKGITKVESITELINAFEYAMNYTRCKRVIIEEYIETPYNQLHGDGFIYKGELVFLGLCDHHFKNAVPISSTYPSKIIKAQTHRIKKEVSRLIQLVGFENGAINVEVRITEEDKLYIMEIGPRSGGNYVPQLMQCGSGFREVAAIVETAMGNVPEVIVNTENNFCLQYIIGTDESGIFLKISFSERFKDKVQMLYLHKNPGEVISSYKDSSNVLGVLIAKCEDADELEDTINKIKEHVKVKMKNN